MWATPFEKLLWNLNGEMPQSLPEFLPKDVAYQRLKKMTGEDFGYDANAWREWGRANAKFLHLPKIQQ
ncbi:MAG: hypothetical protein KY475_18060 [Planctomycetes bacterium]|nr:hypothetical protein [Planctomycetota bacterium]